MAGAVARGVHGRRFTIDGTAAVSFVTPSYLGLEQHPAVRAAAMDAVRRCGVTLGTPRALIQHPLAAALERHLARFVGQPAALIFPSASHAARDALETLAGDGGTIFIDRWAYPTSVEGAYCARRRGVRVIGFPHGDLDALAWLLRRTPSRGAVIVVDGVYVAGGEMAPLGALVSLAERADAVVYMDDSHGLGVLGTRSSGDRTPFGRGGGGLLRYAGVPRRRVFVAGTVAKALGAPLAFVAGGERALARIEKRSSAFVHSSPPSTPNVAAALAALRVLDIEGPIRLARLAALVSRFRAAATSRGFDVIGNESFPIQGIRLAADGAEAVGRALWQAGVMAAPQFSPADAPDAAVLRFFITALHTPGDIDLAVDRLALARAHAVLMR